MKETSDNQTMPTTHQEPIRVIKQRPTDTGWEIKVIIGTPPHQTKHRVTLSRTYWQQFTNETTPPDQLIIASFKFLLDHEPKESILPYFDLPLINTYFPNYEETITKHLNTK